MMRFFIGLCVLFASVTAAAQEAPTWRYGGGLGARRLGDTTFATASLHATMANDWLRMGVELPLQLQVNGPQATQLQLRSQDWDEKSDFTKLLRYCILQTPVAHDGEKPMLKLHLGEPTGHTLGHGSIVHKYYNLLEVDHYKTAALANAEFSRGGAEVFVNDVIGLDVLAARAFFQPTGSDSALRGLTFGVTAAVDLHATHASELQALPAVPDANLRYLAPWKQAQTWVVGADALLPLLREKSVDLGVYLDLNAMRAAVAGDQETTGGAVHLGTQLHVVASETQIDLQAELRGWSAGGQPAVFDERYELRRTATVVGGAPSPLPPTSPSGAGALISLDLNAPGYFAANATVDVRNDGSIWSRAWLALPEWHRVTLHGHISDGGALPTFGMGALHVRVFEHWRATAQAGRRVVLLGGAQAAQDDFAVGLGLQWVK